MFRPKMKEINELSKGYNRIPISYEMFSDAYTPVEMMKILKKNSKHCYMLESVERQEVWGRYTFLGYDPVKEITCENNQVQIREMQTENILSFQEKEPYKCLRKELEKNRSPIFDYLPGFTGGFVGYFSYDYIKYLEPSLDLNAEDTEGFKDFDLMLFNKVIIFDNVKQKIIFIYNMKTEGSLKAQYEKAVEEIQKMIGLVQKGEKVSDTSGRLKSDFSMLFKKEEYCEMVRKAQDYIYEGDIFQVVLSNRMEGEFEGSLFDTYRFLRTSNPSPYMFYFSSDDMEVAGASPETLVKLENGILHTFPLAGTRPRGKTKEEDQLLEKELLEDEKELAEHNMLVDLGRNDLGKVSKFGSVCVEGYKEIEKYSHVMHIGSTVRSEIMEKKDALDAIGAVLPAGTLSGAPKIRACEIINELEGNKRGIYGGAIGYLGFTGNMDTCIAIRLVFKKNGKLFVRSGAGIVADSVPEKEFEECTNKASAVLEAVKNSGEVKSNGFTH